MQRRDRSAAAQFSDRSAASAACRPAFRPPATNSATERTRPWHRLFDPPSSDPPHSLSLSATCANHTSSTALLNDIQTSIHTSLSHTTTVSAVRWMLADPPPASLHCARCRLARLPTTPCACASGLAGHPTRRATRSGIHMRTPFASGLRLPRPRPDWHWRASARDPGKPQCPRDA